MRIKYDLQARVGFYRIWPEYHLSKEAVSVLSFYFHVTGPLQNSQMKGTENLLVSQSHNTHTPESVTPFVW